MAVGWCDGRFVKKGIFSRRDAEALRGGGEMMNADLRMMNAEIFARLRLAHPPAATIPLRHLGGEA